MDTNTKTKPRRRVANKTRYQKNQATKKKAREHREVRAVSRKQRSYVRSQISEFPSFFWDDQPCRSVLIILHDGTEADRILFQVNNIGKGHIYLSLPTINLQDLGTKEPVNTEGWIDAVKTYARDHYGVEPRFAHEFRDFILLSNCKLVESVSGLSPVMVYAFKRWHWDRFEDWAFLNGNATCTYTGKQLKEYIKVHGDVAKIHLRHETLERVFYYRLMSGRMTEFHDEEEKPQGGEQNAG
jgi:hypothetical protein